MYTHRSFLYFFLPLADMAYTKKKKKKPRAGYIALPLKTDSWKVPASKNTNDLNALQGDCKKFAGCGFFSQESVHASAKALSATPCFVGIDPRLGHCR